MREMAFEKDPIPLHLLNVLLFNLYDLNNRESFMFCWKRSGL